MPTISPIVVTPDVARIRRFYEDVLGAVEVRRVPDDGPVFFIGLRIGDSELGVVAAREADLPEPSRIVLSMEVADVDALLPLVEQAGGTVDGPPNDMPWGQRVAHVKDPDGNAVNLTHTLDRPPASPPR